MGVDQARHDGLACEINHLGANRWSEVILFDRSDALAGDEDRDLFSGLIGGNVNQPGVLQQSCLRHKSLLAVSPIRFECRLSRKCFDKLSANGCRVAPPYRPVRRAISPPMRVASAS